MILLLLAVSLLLILVNGVFVLVEFGLVRVRPSRIEMLARHGGKRALAAQDILSRLDVYLAAIQLGITVCSLALGWIGEPAIAKLLTAGFHRLPFEISPKAIHVVSFGLALALLSFGHIVLGELVPRSIGIQLAEATTLWAAIPLKFFNMVIRAPIAFMAHCSVSILRLMGFKPAAESESIVTEEEMRILLGETQEKGTLPFERLMLLENLFDFGGTRAGEVMTPLERAAFLSLDKSWPENLEAIRSRRLSRYLLCESGVETIVGMVHVKDLVLKTEPGAVPDLRALRRDLVEIKDSDPIEKLLKVFPDKGVHLALVKDGAGKAVGLLSLEDILEELVGEVHDEHDLPQAWSLSGLVVPGAVAIAMLSLDRQSAITQLLDKLHAAVPELDVKETFRLIWDRETKFSSGVGRGIAVPHARLPSLSRPIVALGRFAKAVPFPAPDAVPVRLVFLILTPASTPILQLKILQRIASLGTNENLRRKLLRAKSAEHMLELLRTADTMLAV
ncbi:MAG: CNNM domain-containing protein [Elusimicrobiota bacterium]|jgi:CBS domain containing-hemolysin-like protein